MFALYTTNNLTKAFAYIEPNPILVETNVEKMEGDLYKIGKDVRLWRDPRDTTTTCE